MVHVRLGSVHGTTLHAKSATSLLAAGLVALSVGAVGLHYSPKVTSGATAIIQAATPVIEEIVESGPIQAMTETAVEVQALAASVVAPTPEIMTRTVELNKGRTLAQMLMDAAVPSDQAMAASDALGKVFDHRKLRAGQEMTMTVSVVDDQHTLSGLVFEPETTKEIAILRLYDGSYNAELKSTPIERRRIAAQGEIKSSLYAAGAAQGVPQSIMASLIRAYSHQIDFQRDIRKGDSFEILYDQPTARNGSAVGQGVIIYAALITGGKTYPIYRVTFGDGAVDYFNEKGQSVRRSLLRTPLDSARVTSNFGMRRHPILGYSRMHQGVDFGAPSGTPIYAAGGGVVVEARWNGGYGRYIKIRHNNRTHTAYAHMNRFAKSVRPGSRVKQGDVIGFVGSTGRSTGPHLHYEVIVDGKQVNPLKVSMPTGRVLTGKTLEQFKNGQSKLKGEFHTLLTQKKVDPELAQPATLKNDSIKVAAKS